MKFSRTWAMPSADTFSIAPIEAFVRRYLKGVSVDPFARNKDWATYTNDLNPDTKAQSHLDAEVFLDTLSKKPVACDCLLFDPPYSPRQISECYKSIGREVGMEGTQNASLYKRCRDAAMNIMAKDSYALSFGWNSAGMGKERGFEIVEILLVCHGGGHNDTICLAERRLPTLL